MVIQPPHRKLLDPLNRLYRYQVASAMAEPLKSTKITPNMVTLAHTGVGIYAAWLVYHQHYVLAAFFYEIRTVLDCLDGVLARLKNQSTALGRTLDTIGDGIAFNALMVAGALRVIRDYPSSSPYLITLSVFSFAFVAAHCGTVYQLMKRKLGSIIQMELDTVEVEWHEHFEQTKKFDPLRLSKVGFLIDSLTIRLVSNEWYRKVRNRRDHPEWKSKALSESWLMNELAQTTRVEEFRRAIRSTSFVSDDNIFTVISLCFVIQGVFPGLFPVSLHPIVLAFGAGFAYAVVSLLVGLHDLHDFLRGVYRD